MFFGIVMPLNYWIIAAFIAILIFLLPLVIIDTIANPFSEPLRSIIRIVGSYLVLPALVTSWYRYRMKAQAKGSVIFWFYCIIFVIMFGVFTVQLFQQPLSLESVAGPLVTGIVAAYMISVARKTKSQVIEAYNKQYEMQQKSEREEDIRRQAEAMVLAEKMKNEQLNKESIEK